MSRRDTSGPRATLSDSESTNSQDSADASERVILLKTHEEAMQLFGPRDRHLKLLRDAFGVQLTGRGCRVTLSGRKDAVEEVSTLLEEMVSRYRSGAGIPRDFAEKAALRRAAVENGGERKSGDPAGDSGQSGEAPPRGDSRLGSEEAALVRRVARSPGQAAYLESILQNEIVFCIGPAGTGKTFLAVYMAIHLLKADKVRKLCLCRPAVEAGEKLGFLPGDFQAKINPYLRPLYDALNDLLDFDRVKRYIEREVIEILPLAYMRGRTLNNAFIILDEGQNTSVSQMKMFLTRMGMNSRIIVTGDVTQVDLPGGQLSGLIHALNIMDGIDGIGLIQLDKQDIVRHPLVRRIVAAYEQAEEERSEDQ